jgi:hypothetical protein
MFLNGFREFLQLQMVRLTRAQSSRLTQHEKKKDKKRENNLLSNTKIYNKKLFMSMKHDP